MTQLNEMVCFAFSCLKHTSFLSHCDGKITYDGNSGKILYFGIEMMINEVIPMYPLTYFIDLENKLNGK